jgi:hypothetical protein
MKNTKVSIYPSVKDKEYKILWYYEQIDKSKVSTLFYLMYQAIENGSVGYVDLEETKKSMLVDFAYLKISKTYLRLQLASKETLIYTETSFVLDGHEFQTLKEVERALKLRAFL